jgi:hypothetical protein
LEAALEVERVVRAAQFSFCFIGGIAVQRWGQPRMTVDIDLTVITGFGDEERHVDGLLASLAGRLEDARAFALQHRTLLLIASNGVHVDVSLGAMPFEERSVERASRFAISDRDAITTCSAEDLIVHKAFAGRDKDWGDIRGIVARQAQLDHGLIWEELSPLLELRDDTETEAKLRQLLSVRKKPSRK